MFIGKENRDDWWNIKREEKQNKKTDCKTWLDFQTDLWGRYQQFLKLSKGQKTLTEKVKTEQQEVDTYKQKQLWQFRVIIREYVEITELTATIVNKFVKKSLSMPRIK